LLLSKTVHASSVMEAERLFQSRQYGSAASICAEALELEPDNLDLRILRARALMALRRDEEAKRELSRALRWHPASGEAYRLLGELAIRRGKLKAASTFLRQAVRFSSDENASARGLLDLIESSNQPTVAVEKLPAATATVGCPFSVPAPPPEHVGLGSSNHLTTTATEPARPRARRLAAGSQNESTQEIHLGDRFGRYLVDIGALTPLQLRAALDYHRRAGVRLGAAAVALGFLSEPSVEWAAHDYHAGREPS
jgi:tetratricopeptide (TPR) repeat protein